MKLSDLGIRKISPRKIRFEVADGKGLSLRITPTGTKTWVFRYMIEGKARRMTFGTFPTISLSEARELHSKAMQDIEKGIDPGEKQKEAKANKKAAPTIEDLVTEFWEMELQHSPSGKERKRLMTKDVLPVWASRKAMTITRRDTVLLIDSVRNRAPIAANRLQGVLVRMFNFAAERGILEYSPLTGMRKKPEQPRQRVLTDDEIRLLWSCLELENMAMDVYRVTKLALKMILLTGQRPGEVCGMTWEEIDQDGFWNIPPERRKGGIAQRVPLSTIAQEVLDQAKLYSGEKSFVFASSHKSNSPLTSHALSKAINRHWKELGFQEPFTPHDLRRTVRTRLAEIGIDDVIAERVIGGKHLLETRHVQDALSPLRVVANPLDDIALMRFLTLFKRVGEKTAAAAICSISAKPSLDRVVTVLRDQPKIPSLAVEVIEAVRQHQTDVAKAVNLAATMLEERIAIKFSLDSWVKRKQDFPVIEKLATKYTSISEFIHDYLLNPLYGVQVKRVEDKDVVKLITIHSAKGSESKVAYVVNVSPGAFPSSRSLGNMDEVEEERRVLNVAVTRAMDELIVTRNGYRQWAIGGGNLGDSKAEGAYFLNNLPEGLFDEHAHGTVDCVPATKGIPCITPPRPKIGIDLG